MEEEKTFEYIISKENLCDLLDLLDTYADEEIFDQCTLEQYLDYNYDYDPLSVYEELYCIKKIQEDNEDIIAIVDVKKSSGLMHHFLKKDKYKDNPIFSGYSRKNARYKRKPKRNWKHYRKQQYKR